MKAIAGAGLLCALGLLLGGCPGGDEDGVCVVQSPLGGQYTMCNENYTEDECSGLSDSSFDGGNSCSELGYTVHCSGDPATTFRMNCP